MKKWVKWGLIALGVYVVWHVWMNHQSLQAAGA